MQLDKTRSQSLNLKAIFQLYFYVQSFKRARSERQSFFELVNFKLFLSTRLVLVSSCIVPRLSTPLCVISFSGRIYYVKKWDNCRE